MTNPHDPEEGKRTIIELRDEILKRLDEKYTLIYPNYDDKLTNDQVETLVEKGAIDEFWDSTDDWESETRWSGAQYEYDQVVNQVVQEWQRADADQDYGDLAIEFDSSEYKEEIFEAIMDRDDSDWPRELAGHTPDVLMRVLVLDEDEGFPMGEPNPEPADALTRLGLPITDANLKTIAYTINNADPQWDGALAFWIFGLDVETLYSMSTEPDTVIEVENPYVYIGNPLQGNGFISERPLEGLARIKRSDLRTDKGAYGYPVSEVYGGLDGSQFSAEIKVVEKEDSK